MDYFLDHLMKEPRLWILTSSFEEIRMEVDEKFDEFYAKLKDIEFCLQSKRENS